MSNDGICVHMVQKLFKRIHLDKYHDYKVNISFKKDLYAFVIIIISAINVIVNYY